MAGLYEGVEEVAFKRVAGGYVFQANNPCFIGPRRRYLVNEAQKAELAACIRETLQRSKPFIFAAAVFIPTVMLGSVFGLIFSGASRGAVMGFSMFLFTLLFAAYVALLHVYSMGRLEPLLAGLPRTEERINFYEGSNRFATKVSNKLLAVIGFSAAMSLMGNGLHLLSQFLSYRSIDYVNIFGIAAAVPLTVYVAYLVFLRMRPRHNGA